MKQTIIAFVILITTSCYYNDGVSVDQQTWEYDLPRNTGLFEDELLNLDTLIAGRWFETITGLIIIKDEKLVFENYYFGSERDQLVNLGQSSIVFSWAALGVAIDKGFLNLSDSIFNFLPEYADVFNLDPAKRAINFEHILLNAIGFPWNEYVLRGFENPENDVTIMKNQDDWIRYLLEKPLEAPPGRRTTRNSAGGLLIAKALENATGQSFDSFLAENVFEPIGIGPFNIDRDNVGNFDAGTGISVSLIDFTKFGYLVIQEGISNERTVLNPNYVFESTQTQFAINDFQGAGYLWRLFSDDSFYGKTIFYDDEFGQHIYIQPEQNMIVSISAENFLTSNFTNNSFAVFNSVYQSLILP